MSKRQVLNPHRQASTGAYSDGIVAGGFLFISGQGAVDLATGKVVPGTIEEQTRRTLGHIDAILQQAGCTRDDVVKATVHLADIGEFARYNQVYSAFFAGIRPARTTVQSVLPADMKIEIDVIAKAPDGGATS